ncbi:MAG: hypothetical protein IH598_05165 [Bacteroidales bacterium]|nr:hypothetical protein [Bacteroidales bacterium]
MKKSKLSTAMFAMMLSAMFFATGCRDKVYETVTYTANEPVYMSFDEFRGSVKTTATRELSNPGKIYFKDNLLYINEINEGIHVIDNTDPSSPQKIAFIEIPGNIDLAIRENILFADSYIDLVALDITNPSAPVLVDRLENAFPNVLPPMDISLPVVDLDFERGVVVGWNVKQHTETIEKGNAYNKQWVSFDGWGVANLASSEITFNRMSSTGIAGSMARFTIYSDYMYVVQNNTLKLFNIANIPGISTGNQVSLERAVETIFPYQDKLFLGTTTGMLVYSLSSPATPVFVSAFDHINSCDPVVVQGNLAYVTLRSGTQCFGFTNQLDVIDISSLQNPFLVKTYPMFNPHGLGIDGSVLFVCDGDAGLKVYDATDPMEIHMNQLAHFPEIKAYDVIPFNGVLMMIGADGLYQYDYTNNNEIVLLSSIPVISDGN